MLSEQAITNDSRTVAFTRNQAAVLQVGKGTHRQIDCRPLLYKTVDIRCRCSKFSMKVRRPFNSVDGGAVIQWYKQEDG